MRFYTRKQFPKKRNTTGFGRHLLPGGESPHKGEWVLMIERLMSLSIHIYFSGCTDSPSVLFLRRWERVRSLFLLFNRVCGIFSDVPCAAGQKKRERIPFSGYSLFLSSIQIRRSMMRKENAMKTRESMNMAICPFVIIMVAGCHHWSCAGSGRRLYDSL